MRTHAHRSPDVQQVWQSSNKNTQPSLGWTGPNPCGSVSETMLDYKVQCFPSLLFCLFPHKAACISDDKDIFPPNVCFGSIKLDLLVNVMLTTDIVKHE